MLDIREFLDPTMAPDARFGIEAKIMLWINAGSGKVLALEPRYLAIEGVLQVFGKESPLSVQVALGEPEDAGDTLAGPCTLRIADEADGQALYRVEGERLLLSGTIDGVLTTIAISAQAGRSLIEITGKRSVTLRLTVG